MMTLAFAGRWILGVEYFFNAIFVSVVGLGLSDVIYRWLASDDEARLKP